MNRKGVVQGIIIAMVAFVIAAGTVFLVYRYLGETRYPLHSEQVIKEDYKTVAFQLGNLVDACWEDSEYGSRNLDQDCFYVTVKSNQNLSKKEIQNQIEYETPKNNFKSINFKENEEIRVKVVYNAQKGSVEIKGFMEVLNGVCESQYGEDCFFPDCNCSKMGVSDICLTSYDENKINEVGCVLPQFIHVKQEGTTCTYDWECVSNLECSKTVKFNDFEKACCPNGTGWNGQKCIRLKDMGENCQDTEECKVGLVCNTTTLNFTAYSNACCSLGKHWNGSDCVYQYGERCNENYECDVGLKCNPTVDKSENVCCPSGEKWNGTDCKLAEVDVLIVALEKNMDNVYSKSQKKKLEDKIEEYISVISQYSDLVGYFVYLDSDQTSDIIGSKVTKPSDWKDIDGVLDQVVPKLNAKYVIILGGYSRFPSAKAGAYSTDVPYSDQTKNDVSDIVIGRVPEANGGDMDALLTAFSTFIEVHEEGGIDLSTHIGRTLGSNYLTMECWSLNIWGAKCTPYANCKVGTSDSSTAASGKSFFYITQHGSAGPPQYYASAIYPNNLNSMDVSGAFWMIVPCHGGVINYNSASQGVVLNFIKNGGAIHISSTATNCCATTGSSCSSQIDPWQGRGGIGLMYYQIAKRFGVGKKIGDAFKEGKIAFKSISGRDKEYYANCLYGDPTIQIKNMW